MELMTNQSDCPWWEVLNLTSDGASLPMAVTKGCHPCVSIRMMSRILWGSPPAKPQVHSAGREKAYFPAHPLWDIERWVICRFIECPSMSITTARDIRCTVVSTYIARVKDELLGV